ncbi:MAG: hypothetical protein VB934_18050, partial [Polyangiaceae bacterium]
GPGPPLRHHGRRFVEVLSRCLKDTLAEPPKPRARPLALAILERKPSPSESKTGYIPRSEPPS